MSVVPGHQRLNYTGLAAWERVRTETRERNAEALSLAVARERAEMAAAKLVQLTGARAREAARVAPVPHTPPSDAPAVGSVAWHRAQARAWAAENEPNLTDGHLRRLTEQARGRVDMAAR